jgi:hypothetical protein
MEEALGENRKMFAKAVLARAQGHTCPVKIDKTVIV